jgi:Uma2 family endonuclease
MQTKCAICARAWLFASLPETRLVERGSFWYLSWMSVSQREAMTVDEFLDWETRQALKYEFDGFAPVAMTGGTQEHALIQINLTTALRVRLRGGPCRVVGSELKISVAGSIRYPDAYVYCTNAPRGTLVVTEPVVVFEILSPTTALIDRIDKNREYRDTPSVQRYVMLEQDRQGVTVFTRTGDDWVGHLVEGDAVLSMPEIGVDLPLSEVYEGILFPDPEPDDA